MAVNDKKNINRILSDVRNIQKERENTYRERALKLFPWICGRCSREFSGKRLRELTVHHKDHNHDNNPPDGSNWELLCLYCHDNEHSRLEVSDAYDTGASDSGEPENNGFVQTPFAGLADMIKKKEKS